MTFATCLPAGDFVSLQPSSSALHRALWRLSFNVERLRICRQTVAAVAQFEFNQLRLGSAGQDLVSAVEVGSWTFCSALLLEAEAGREE